ncbi:hypothetical protein [Priestia megaterium]|uniref:hypothetical protein n=1 Tax=Priestia megaterium TaxID=1404 RepID=UPI002E23AC1E|nr:hypothetical protein [Priestia megaterium]
MGFYKKIKDTFASIVSIGDSDVAVPVDVQASYAETKQTHNGISVAGNGFSNGQFFDCSEFNRVAVTMKGANANVQVEVQWSHDGVNSVNAETTGLNAPYETATKAKFVRLTALNKDTNAQNISAWLYLKA